MSDWEAICRERVANARTWNLSERRNRGELHQWQRRLWWARYGTFLSAASTSAVGLTVGHVLAMWWL